MGIFQTMLEKVRGSKPPTKKRMDDINLPDEKKGKLIGILGHSDDKGTYGRAVLGGDPEDPRWGEHNKRVAGLFPTTWLFHS
jgi:hypothetical protein